MADANGGTNIESSNATNVVPKKALSTETDTVNQGEEITVTFINDIVNQEQDTVKVSVGLSNVVVKTDGSVIKDCDEEFTFQIIAGDENFPMPKDSSVKVKGNGE